MPRKRLKESMDDFDGWNNMTVEQRAQLLRIGLWNPFNLMMSKLSPQEKLDLQTHPEFKPLRLQFNRTRASGDEIDNVLALTDMLYAAIRKLRGNSFTRDS